MEPPCALLCRPSRVLSDPKNRVRSVLRALYAVRRGGNPRPTRFKTARTISLLEDDNHVIAWQPRFSRGGSRRRAQEGGPERGVHLLGDSAASTTRRCLSRSTQNRWTPAIRSSSSCWPIGGSPASCTRFMTGVMQLQTLYTARVDRGVDVADESSPAGQKAVEQMLLSWATWRYRFEYYDQTDAFGDPRRRGA